MMAKAFFLMAFMVALVVTVESQPLSPGGDQEDSAPPGPESPIALNSSSTTAAANKDTTPTTTAPNPATTITTTVGEAVTNTTIHAAATNDTQEGETTVNPTPAGDDVTEKETENNTETPRDTTPQSSPAVPSNPTTEKPVAPEPSAHARHFDGWSFFGGILLCVGIMSVAFVASKYYKKIEQNYEPLQFEMLYRK